MELGGKEPSFDGFRPKSRRPEAVSEDIILTFHVREGSFSAASTATIARNGAFFRIFRDLQDFHAFAPLRTQHFKKIHHLCQNLTKFLNKFPDFCKKSVDFCEKLLIAAFFKVFCKFCKIFENLAK